jgi:multiple antibiotic resistance protein
MLEATKGLLLSLSAIFPIVDPIGGSPLFLALNGEYGSEARRALSWRIAPTVSYCWPGSYFVGTYILAFFGISLPGSASRQRNGPLGDGVDSTGGKRRRL